MNCCLIMKNPFRMQIDVVTMAWGQFTIQNWPPHVAAYTFRLQIVGATIARGQFTIQNWPPHVAA